MLERFGVPRCCCGPDQCCATGFPNQVTGNLSFTNIIANAFGQTWPASIGPFTLATRRIGFRTGAIDPCLVRTWGCLSARPESPDSCSAMLLYTCAEPGSWQEETWAVTWVSLVCDPTMAARGCGPCDKWRAAVGVNNSETGVVKGTPYGTFGFFCTGGAADMRSDQCCSDSPLLMTFRGTYRPSSPGACCMPSVDITLTITE